MENMNNNSNNHHGNKKGFLKHGLGMMVCCLLPILLVALVPLLGIQGGGIISALAVLACPIGMGIMMFTMSRSNNGGSCHGHSDNKSLQAKDNE